MDVPENDKEIESAIRQARLQWSRFAEAFPKRKPGDKFMVKAPFRADGTEEHIWLNVDSIQDINITGKLQSDADYIKGLKKGTVVTVSSKEISDWAYSENNNLYGGFVEQILQRRADENKKK